MSDSLYQQAIDYHKAGSPGKIEVVPTKPLSTQRDLALAYSPGVAAACEAIAEDPLAASEVTARGNLVAVITNGTAVLGLGAIGPLASKPVMEGKGVLFKKFSGIDVFDIEVQETDPKRFIEVVAALEPSFGGINLEDIKAPECFEIERSLRERMSIPVFHDDQHGTAIVASSAVYNGLRLVGKKIEDVKLVASGAGAASLACLDLMVSMGMRKEHITIVDRSGVVYAGRTQSMDPHKARYSVETSARTLAEAIEGADIFLGCSGPGVLTREMVKAMAADPLVLALANPTPEILPEEAKAARDDVIIATGRSDYPNQVNNVLCFPFIFRGALDVGASEINEDMKIACVKAISNLAMAEASDLVTKAYGGEPQQFGPDYLIPKPFDPRLIVEVSSAVAQAAMDSGVARRPVEDMRAYRRKLGKFLFRSSSLMEPVVELAKEVPHKVVFAEGEEPRVLQALQQLVDDSVVTPLVVGRPDVIETRIKQLGLRLRLDRDVEVTNPLSDERFREYWETYYQLRCRDGISPAEARTVMRTQNTAIAAVMVQRGEAEAMICGAEGRSRYHIRHVIEIIGCAEGVEKMAAMTVLVTSKGILFICDSHINVDPSAEELLNITELAVEQVSRFGVEPRVAFLSHSNFGTSKNPSSRKMRRVCKMFKQRNSDLVVDGEMHADAALSSEIRDHSYPDSSLRGAANVLVMPNLDAAHITYGALKVMSGAVSVGPILLGAAKSVHVVTPSITVRGLVNMAAIAAITAKIGD